jgi:hypothetical protein
LYVDAADELTSKGFLKMYRKYEKINFIFLLFSYP